MGRTKEQQREYMAAYRARKKAEPKLIIRVADETRARIAELEEEVARLKRELAARGREDMTIHPVVDPHPFGTSRPAPKSGATRHR